MDTKYYICLYCHEEFIPKRRYAQKFCSATCRSKAHHQKNKNLVSKSTSNLKPNIPVPDTTNKIEKITPVGVATAAAGSLLADAAKYVLTNANNKPATKGDILALGEKIERYHRVLNIALGINGELPYFDMVTKQIVYFKNTSPFKKL